MSTWIYRVAVNSALMALRSSKPKIETVSVDFGLLEASTEIDDAHIFSLESFINAKYFIYFLFFIRKDSNNQATTHWNNIG